MQLARLKSAYARLPPRLRARVPPGLEDWLRARALPLLGAGPVAALEDRLWGGFSRPARAGLEALLAADPRTAAAAALALARWHGARGEPEAALALARAARDPAFRDRRQFMLEALFLAQAGRGAEARALIDARVRGFDASAALLRAGTLDDDAHLAALNAVLARCGLGPLALRDSDAPLSLDNLRGAGAAAVTGPLVTVIVPVHDAAGTLGTALASLAEQTHAALEVLVVDDASTDRSPAIAAAIAARDPRFRLIRQPKNLGGYAARNRALAEARGDFVTVQDADDWSHPERIARHLAAGGAASISDWTRVTAELGVTGPWRPSPNLVSHELLLALLPPRVGGALRPLGHRPGLRRPRVRRPPRALRGPAAPGAARRPARLRPQRCRLADPRPGHPRRDAHAWRPPRVPRGGRALAREPRRPPPAPRPSWRRRGSSAASRAPSRRTTSCSSPTSTSVAAPSSRRST